MGASEFVIRTAGVDDVRVIAELRSRWTAGACADAGFVGRVDEWLKAEGARRTTWLAFEARAAIGMVGLYEFRRMPKPGAPDSRWGYVGNMFVSDDRRNRGIGTALLRELLGEAERRRYARLVVAPSPASFSFWQRVGFVIPGSAPDGETLMLLPRTARAGSAPSR
jgi:GNAT superfamily N-acetyltransferase